MCAEEAMPRQRLLAFVAFCVSTAAPGHDLPRRAVPAGMSEYIAMVQTAAPEAVSKNATIVRVNDIFDVTDT
jgi:hypothetical protein